MTDKQFEALIQRTANAYNRYKPLLEAAEAEYQRRYGSSPSDWDDDAWIDTLHGACGAANSLTVALVEEGARMSGWSGSSAPDSGIDDESSSAAELGGKDADVR
jgi:hypothetical protein